MAELMKGMFFDRPKEGAPEFVKGKLSIKVADAIPFLEANKNGAGYVNADLLLSKDKTKLYLQLNDWKPENKATEPEVPPIDETGIPF
jgi:hypothetical protein